MKVIVHTRFAREQLLEALGSEPRLEVAAIDAPEQLGEALRDAHALVMPGQAYGAVLARQLREHAPQLRLLQLLTAGYDLLQVHGVPAGSRLTIASISATACSATAGDQLSPAVATRRPAGTPCTCSRS